MVSAWEHLTWFKIKLSFYILDVKHKICIKIQLMIIYPKPSTLNNKSKLK